MDPRAAEMRRPTGLEPKCGRKIEASIPSSAFVRYWRTSLSSRGQFLASLVNGDWHIPGLTKRDRGRASFVLIQATDADAMIWSTIPLHDCDRDVPIFLSKPPT